MKLELATKQYIKANRSPARLIAAAGGAIKGLKPEWEKIMTAVLSALIEDFGNEIAEDLGAEKSESKLESESETKTELKWEFDPMSAAARAWIVKHGAESVTSILATNLDEVRTVIVAGVDEGLTTPQISRNIRKFYTDRSSWKAMRVARTEVGSAAGFGQREAAKQSGVVKTKKWLSSRDARVRDSHLGIDGQERTLDERYSNGLMYPGDPSGEPAESINCRCVEEYGTTVAA